MTGRVPDSGLTCRNRPRAGARYRDYGWWVPLRHVAKTFGWRVEWLHAEKEAVVYTGG